MVSDIVAATQVTYLTRPFC